MWGMFLRDKLSGLTLLKAALANRKMGVMLIFGFSAGLPYTLLLGTLYAWLGEAKVDLATIGILSWIGLAYAFKFLWSPLVDQIRLPGLEHFGRRRSWLLLCQVILALTFLLLSLADPAVSIGWFAMIAVVGAFASATQDVVIDAWRIDVADEIASVEILSTVYQFGYRIAALVGGALALVMAARISWPTVYAVMGVLMFAAICATLIAPDTPRSDIKEIELAFEGEVALAPRIRAIALVLVGAGWIWAIATIAIFMARVLNTPPGSGGSPSVSEFTKFTGPWIVVATVIFPALIAATLNWMKANGVGLLRQRATSGKHLRKLDHAYGSLIMPLTELIGRLRLGTIVVVALILSYRLCDSIWGPFAFPFYLEEMKYTNDEVAFASKIFGVIMTIFGISIGGILFATIGRMPTLLIGAITAAGSNLLYADLASGSHMIDAFAHVTGLTVLGGALGTDDRMIRLMIAISGENIAGGLAGAAFVAYLSSITSKSHSAVQYALLSSLTFLVGSLGRAALGEAIELHGYAPVFRFTALLGTIAIILCLVEWLRSSRQARRFDREGSDGGRAEAG